MRQDLTPAASSVRALAARVMRCMRAGKRQDLTPLILAAALAGCGGAGSNPFGNPATVDNPVVTGGRKLSFAYFQKCVQPVFLTTLSIVQNGVRSQNTCAAAGCHDDVSGTGGALRILPAANAIDLADPAATPERIRATEMYRNFYSAQGEAIPGQPLQSRLMTKPLLLNVLHGGGLVFESADDPLLKRIAYWINRPMPQGQDEFSRAADAMFTPADAATGACNVE
jgi:hypothetical protein